MHEALQGATFHVEHVTPRSAGGSSTLENLAWACPSCNLHKADRVEGVDPGSKRQAPLFNPRRDPWDEHFEWNGEVVVPHTATGRATVHVLDLNSPRRLRIRKAERVFGLFPP